ncbi:MAG: hypothetical protein ROR55_25895 [Devosia sp.]
MLAYYVDINIISKHGVRQYTHKMVASEREFMNVFIGLAGAKHAKAMRSTHDRSKAFKVRTIANDIR